MSSSTPSFCRSCDGDEVVWQPFERERIEECPSPQDSAINLAESGRIAGARPFGFDRRDLLSDDVDCLVGSQMKLHCCFKADRKPAQPPVADDKHGLRCFAAGGSADRCRKRGSGTM